MVAERRRRWLPTFIGVACITAAFLAWLVPVVMLPFVNVLPYLHTMPAAQRFSLSAVCYLLACAITRAAMAQQQWTEVRTRTLRTWKQMLGVGLGLLMATYAAAALSANTLGLLVRLIPAREVVREFTVVKVKSSGSNFKAIELELSSSSSPQLHEIVLSKRMFGDLPKLKPGDVVRFEALENVFGTYVLRVWIN